MIPRRITLSFALVCPLVFGQAPPPISPAKPSPFQIPGGTLHYPATRKGDVVEDYHGAKVADPYRWLEDDHSSETKAWVEAQNKVTFDYLDKIPQRAPLKSRLTRLFDYQKVSTLSKRGKYFFYFHNTGLQNQPVLYVTDNLQEKGRILLDLNPMSQEGTVALRELIYTDDGKYIAYGLTQGGSDWVTFKIREVATGMDLKDEVKWSKNGKSAWKKDGSGFFYCRFEVPEKEALLTKMDRFQKVYFHRLGTSQEQDQLVFENKDHSNWLFRNSVTEDGMWLVILQSEGSDRSNRLFLMNLTKAGAKVEPWLDANDAYYQVVGNDGDLFYLRTDKGAPRKRLMALQAGRKAAWREIIPEAKGTAVLDSVSMVNNQFITKWTLDAHEELKIFGLNGQFIKDVTLPTLGTVSDISGQRHHARAFYTFTSFIYAPTIYQYDFKSGQNHPYKAPSLDFQQEGYETKQIFYSSKDGTKIPMFITYKKGMKLDGLNPTLLWGYGGFNVTQPPRFAVENLVWLEMGGIYAHANLRGGGEYGKAWHDAGSLANKQNVFDDFIAAAEWLIANNYTSTPKLAISGHSNGGLLVGACLTQRPDLFGAALPAVGVLDMLRFHKFTIGWAWKGDYGSSETKEGYDILFNYSPLHTIKPGMTYPPTLVTTGDHDNRVVPAHSHKFIATLQAAQGGPPPVLTRIETNAGHGTGKPTTKVIEERADVLAFLVKNLNVKLP